MIRASKVGHKARGSRSHNPRAVSDPPSNRDRRGESGLRNRIPTARPAVSIRADDTVHSPPRNEHW